MAHIVGAVLAAGAGTRMGGPKAELELAGTRLLDRAVAVLVEGGCAEVLAIVRPGTLPVDRARSIPNPEPDRGLRSSLEIAVAEADPDCDALAVLLVDMPGVGVEAVTAVLAAWRPGRIGIALYGGDQPPRTGHPIVMSLELWRDALTLAGPDEGARGLLRARSELIDEVVVVGTSTDLDHPGDLAAWKARR